MKTMTCKQMGGPCDAPFRGNKADEVIKAQDSHLKETVTRPGIRSRRPGQYDLPFSTWSLSKLADFLVAEGVVDDISHESMRVLLRADRKSTRLNSSHLGIS